MSRDAEVPRGYGVQVKLNDLEFPIAAGYRCERHPDQPQCGGARGTRANRGSGHTRSSVDQGPQSNVALAKGIRIGKLEFQDCVVEVSERTSIDNEEGLIGADVFSSYLIDIDGPNYSLRLSPLPKRPQEPTGTTALDTDGEGAPLPEDRYVAPEMANWSKVFRFGHELLIPTYVNDSPSMLFEIDSGSSSTMISATAARKITKTYRDDMMTVKGLNGTVNKVYSTYAVTLRFNRFAQQNQKVVTFDLSNLSKGVGTEISGLLGFTTLRWLDMKIDYRDGLVDFSYDPMQLPALLP